MSRKEEEEKAAKTKTTSTTKTKPLSGAEKKGVGVGVGIQPITIVLTHAGKYLKRFFFSLGALRLNIKHIWFAFNFVFNCSSVP